MCNWFRKRCEPVHAVVPAILMACTPLNMLIMHALLKVPLPPLLM
jgi:hypothetical protein